MKKKKISWKEIVIMIFNFFKDNIMMKLLSWKAKINLNNTKLNKIKIKKFWVY